MGQHDEKVWLISYYASHPSAPIRYNFIFCAIMFKPYGLPVSYCFVKISVLKVISFAFRYSEFYRLNQELHSACPNLKFPPFPKKIIFGHSQVCNVADKRKVELQTYLQVTHDVAVSQLYCNIYYCVGHPVIPRDHCRIMLV